MLTTPLRHCFLPVFLVLLSLLVVSNQAVCQEAQRPSESISVWPDLAPGETTKLKGETLPFRPGENPPVVRVTGITQPTLACYLPDENPTGAAVLILPGGAFGRVVTNKEGSEIAEWLNRQGIAAFVLSYRTIASDAEKDARELAWKKPVQDAQRSLSLIRSRADEWKLRKDRIGIMGFSAGGQAAARVICLDDARTYDAADTVDSESIRPNFSLLVYPWNLTVGKEASLLPELTVPNDCGPVFLVHTHDDSASSLSSALFYVALKQKGVPAELHVFSNGGHGYGMRPVEDSSIATWPSLAEPWLKRVLAE